MHLVIIISVIMHLVLYFLCYHKSPIFEATHWLPLLSASVRLFLQWTLAEVSIPMLPEGYFILMTIYVKSAHYSWMVLPILKYACLQSWK